ncbi:serine O-acetyltransferase [Subtercola sp. YIM 133946]|uniref:serine O-acetyltransferase n=1 Tax=Subtercola sp. YIM 133946 TaxID=3118909 RepID=UPI002F93A936
MTNLVSDRIQSKDDLRAFLKADYLAQSADKLRFEQRFRKPTLRFTRALRRMEYYNRPSRRMYELPLRALAVLRLSRISVSTGISIPPGAFGKGLGLPHYGSIVVHSKARFGDFCCIQNATNIGMQDGGVPSGGDFIYIAPGAVIFGDVHIGSRSVIGANAVLNKSVPDGTTWAGVPARQLSQTDSAPMMVPAVAALMAAVSNTGQGDIRL